MLATWPGILPEQQPPLRQNWDGYSSWLVTNNDNDRNYASKFASWQRKNTALFSKSDRNMWLVSWSVHDACFRVDFVTTLFFQLLKFIIVRRSGVTVRGSRLISIREWHWTMVWTHRRVRYRLGLLMLVRTVIISIINLHSTRNHRRHLIKTIPEVYNSIITRDTIRFNNELLNLRKIKYQRCRLNLGNRFISISWNNSN